MPAMGRAVMSGCGRARCDVLAVGGAWLNARCRCGLGGGGGPGDAGLWGRGR